MEKQGNSNNNKKTPKKTKEGTEGIPHSWTGGAQSIEGMPRKNPELYEGDEKAFYEQVNVWKDIG